MAILVLFAVDRVNDDFYRNLQCYKRGMVIDILPDGQSVGVETLAHPEWRILSVPGVDPADLSGLLAAEPLRGEVPSRTRQLRAFRLDLDHPAIEKAGLRSFFDDHSIVVPEPKQAGAALPDIQQVDRVMSHVEDVEVTKDAQGQSDGYRAGTTVVARDVVRYAVADIKSAPSMLRALPSEQFVGPDGLRAQCVTEVTADFVAAITIAVPVVDDPAIIGADPKVIG